MKTFILNSDNSNGVVSSIECCIAFTSELDVIAKKLKSIADVRFSLNSIIQRLEN